MHDCEVLVISDTHEFLGYIKRIADKQLEHGELSKESKRRSRTIRFSIYRESLFFCIFLQSPL